MDAPVGIMSNKLNKVMERIRQEKERDYTYLEKCKTPPLTALAIEINSFCNRKCPWCPNHTNRRGVEYLDDAVFYKVVDELREMKFEGKITFNLFNEPLLNRRILVFIEYIRKNIPSCFIYLNTNGDMLKLDFWRALRIRGLDSANVSQYDGRINENIQEILTELDAEEKKRFHVRLFPSQKNRLSDWAGLVPSDRNVKKPLTKSCDRPFYQLCVDYRGRVVLCCHDYFSWITIGNAGREPIAELWDHEVFRYYRTKLLELDRASLELCRSCGD